MTSARRAARGSARTRSVEDPTAEILAGPCIETWAERDRDVSPDSPFGGLWWRARRAWRAACVEWASANGTEAWRLRNRARWGEPWSRDWLLEHDRQDWVDYLEGRTDVPPEGTLPSEWNPQGTMP